MWTMIWIWYDFVIINGTFIFISLSAGFPFGFGVRPSICQLCNKICRFRNHQKRFLGNGVRTWKQLKTTTTTTRTAGPGRNTGKREKIRRTPWSEGSKWKSRNTFSYHVYDVGDSWYMIGVWSIYMVTWNLFLSFSRSSLPIS